MLSRTTRLEALQYIDNGTLLIRILKRITLDDEVLKEEWHRTAIPPGVSVENQMTTVNAHLASMGFDEVPADQIATIAANAAWLHTPAVVEIFGQKVAENEAKLASS